MSGLMYSLIEIIVSVLVIGGLVAFLANEFGLFD